MAKNSESPPDLSVFDLQTISAERRVNFLRIAAIAVFYLIHVVRVTVPKFNELFPSLAFEMGSTVPHQVHISVSVLCLGWLLQCFLVHYQLNQRVISPYFGIYVTLGDLAWLTALLCLSSGATSAMVAGYLLIIMLAGMRFDLRLIRITTIAAGLCYLFLLGATRWPVGLLKEIELGTVSRFHQVMTLVAIVLSGFIMGQVVRHAYLIGRMAMENLEPHEGQERQDSEGGTS